MLNKVTKILFLSFLFLTISANTFAATAFLYQIDLIIFTHEGETKIENSEYLIPPDYNNVINLEQKAGEDEMPYQLLKSSSSTLINEYQILQKQNANNILLHYSWLQPQENNNKVMLPVAKNKDWNIQGSIKIKQSNYYALETDLILENNTENQIAIKYKRRLKPEVVYYLDHPFAGMLIKIHQII